MSSKRKGSNNNSDRSSRKDRKQVQFDEGRKKRREDDDEDQPVVEEDSRNIRADDDDDDTMPAAINAADGEEDFDEREDFTGGYKMEPFNMTEEREEGRFDDSGTFLESKYTSKRDRNNLNFLKGEKIGRKTKRAVTEDDDSDAEGEDAWLEEYDERVERYAAAGKKMPTFAPKKPSFSELEESVTPVNPVLLKGELLKYLQPGETVAGALRRLSKDKKPQKGKKNAKEEKDAFDLLTEAADALLNSGYYNVYNDKREKIEEEMNKKTGNRNSAPAQQPAQEAQAPEKPKVLWEYQIEQQTFGPFSNEEMIAWKDGGYFDGSNAVQVRRVKTDDIFAEEEPFTSSDNVDFHQYQ